MIKKNHSYLFNAVYDDWNSLEMGERQLFFEIYGANKDI